MVTSMHGTQPPSSIVPEGEQPDPVIEVYKKDVDRSLLRENLKLSVEDRIRKLMRLQLFFEEVRRAGKEAKLHDRL